MKKRVKTCARWLVVGAGVLAATVPWIGMAESPPELGVGAAVDPPLLGVEAEAFLCNAEILDMREIPRGVSKPQQVLLSDGQRTARAVWKTIDDFAMLQRFERGDFELRFRDSYRHEVAAYELDKLLGLGLVPPTVERRIGRRSGSLQLWVEGAMTEAERLAQNLRPADLAAWNRQMHTVRLFHQLTYDTDYKNVSNLLVDGTFKIWVIDSSRAFRYHHRLRKERALFRFSRCALERLRGLDRGLVWERLGRWLSADQIEALLARRDLILERADTVVAMAGEGAVLFD